MAGTGTAHLRDPGAAVLRIEHVTVDHADGAGRRVHAVSDVSLDVLPGETVGLVGESGCGKSSTGRAVMQLPRPTAGRVLFGGRQLTALRGDRLRRVRPELQMVFQDPISSLNPRRRAADIVLETLTTWSMVERADRASMAAALLDEVGLDPAEVGDRRPHELSGGQCQRLSIARAMATGPRLLVCDEPVSSLDVSVQAQVLNLIHDVQQRRNLSLLFISHDLAVVRLVCDRVAVMYLGRLCEVAAPEALFARPAHPYTTGLLAANPEPDPDRPPRVAVLPGEPPSPTDPPSGCRFRTRCPLAMPVCAAEVPTLRAVGDDHHVACHAAP